MDEQLPIEELPIIVAYNKQRFTQFNPTDVANWYLMPSKGAKKGIAMYPAMGRQHINTAGINRLVFPDEPRGEFKTKLYSYFVVDNAIYRVDQFWNIVNITASTPLNSLAGNVFFAYLVATNIVFACFVDGQNLYVYREDTGQFFIVTDPNCPKNPQFIASFGNRITVNQGDSSLFFLSQINLGGSGFNPATCFTISGAAVFAQETDVIKQFGVLHNTLYIFKDFTTGVWSNTPSTIDLGGASAVTFPWKKNTTYEYDYGIADPLSLAINFGHMAWLGQNSEGLFQVLSTSGELPKPISDDAISVLFQNNINNPELNPFLENNADGFLYQYENNVFYRLSAGTYTGTQLLDFQTGANSIEYSYKTQTWQRCIELNGERNRIRKHVYFNNKHLVTVQGDNTVYEMSGKFYTNDVRNPLQPDSQAADAYISYPFRYEAITPLIYEDDYAEFETKYIQIDFVWGLNTFVNSTSPFPNATFIIDETNGTDGKPIYVIAENSLGGSPVYLLDEIGNTPEIDSTYYNELFKPSIQIYFSDDGGVSYHPHNIVEFSPLGRYSWRMRWYQLGTSRNRCYKLVCVSPAPMVPLGGTMLRRRVSGGAS